MELEPWTSTSRASSLGEAVRNENNGGNGKLSNFSGSPVNDRDDGDDLDLRRILAVLRRRVLVMGGVAALTMTLASAWFLSRPASYKGNFRLLVEPVTAGSILANALTSDTIQTIQPIASELRGKQGLDYISQIEVLKSETLLEPILAQIQGHYPDIDYETFLKRLKVSRPKESKVLDFNYESTDQQEIKYVLSQLSQAYIRYSVEDRKSNLQRGIEFVDQQIQRQREDVSTLEIRLENFRRDNDLVDPENEARSLSDQVSKIVTEQRANGVKFAAATTLFSNLQTQLGLDAETAIVATNLSQAPTYQALLKQLRELESKLAIESAQFRDNTPVIQELKDERDKLLPLLEEEAYRVSSRSPENSGVNPQTLGYQGTVSQNLVEQLVGAANDVQVLETQDQAMQSAMTALTGQVRNMAGVARQYGQIRRELDIGSGSLSRLLAARENLQLEIARQQSPWQLISKINETNIEDVSRIPLKLLLGGLAGLLMGIGAAFLAEELDRAVKSADELKEMQIPSLGLIPFNRKLKLKGVLVVSEKSKTAVDDLQKYHAAPFMESFYSLDANIRLLGSDSPVRSLVVSSTSPGDGKSTVSSHLALAAAMMGRKVLLVDADLRRPQIHTLFSISNVRGLTTAISTDTKPSNLIQMSSQDSNLYLLPAGQLPPAPARLLSSTKMKRLTEKFIHCFDLVIFDCPPLVFADAKLLATHTDGILLVVGLGKTNRQGLADALKDLHTTAQAPVLGVIANGVKPQAGYGAYNQGVYQRYYSRQDRS